jgi:uncharacterized protein YybS (DUF2232 family)
LLEKGRGLFIWFLCLGILLLVYLGGHLNPAGLLLAGVLMPLPVLLTGWRFGVHAALPLALAAILANLAMKPEWAFFTQNLGFLELLCMGALLGCLQYRGWPPHRAIVVTVVVLNLGTLILFAGQALIQGISFTVLLAQKSGEIMETVSQVLGQTGGGSAALLPGGYSQEELEALLRRLLPGLVVANTGLVAWINIVLARQLAFLLGWAQPDPPLFYWSTPEWLIFAILGAGFLLLVPVATIRFISLNLLIVLSLLYFCQGVAVIAAWFHRFHVPRFMRLLGYPLMFLNPLFVLIVTVGLMDLWLDFRRLDQPRDV